MRFTIVINGVVDTVFLGPDGVYRLYRMMETIKNDERPPKLVVYRGKDGVAKREYIPQVVDAKSLGGAMVNCPPAVHGDR